MVNCQWSILIRRASPFGGVNHLLISSLNERYYHWLKETI